MANFTLHLRMRQHCENAQKVAEFLHNDSRVAWTKSIYQDREYDIN